MTLRYSLRLCGPPSKKSGPPVKRPGPEQTWIMAEIGGSVMTFRLFCYDYGSDGGLFS